MHLQRAIALASAFRYVRNRNFQRGIPMAEETPTGPVEMGADMDYAEHEKTYSIFLFMTKYGIIVCSALMIAMAFGFFAGGGFFSSLIVFVLVVALASYILR